MHDGRARAEDVLATGLLTGEAEELVAGGALDAFRDVRQVGRGGRDGRRRVDARVAAAARHLATVAVAQGERLVVRARARAQAFLVAARLGDVRRVQVAQQTLGATRAGDGRGARHDLAQLAPADAIRVRRPSSGDARVAVVALAPVVAVLVALFHLRASRNVGRGLERDVVMRVDETRRH